MAKKYHCNYCGKSMVVVRRHRINEEISKVGYACKEHAAIVYNKLEVTKKEDIPIKTLLSGEVS
jgi:hypothetical protein